MKKIIYGVIISVFLLFAFAPGQGRAEEMSARRYYEPNMQNLSRLYWALGMVDIDNKDHIDNFMLINECDIYREYFSNDFEWKGVRKSARDYITDNKDDFPLRYRFVQPLRLTNYDFENKEFAVLDEYKIYKTRNMQVSSSNSRVICGYTNDLEGYPRMLALKLSRPFSLHRFPVKPEIAETYIKQKLAAFRQLEEDLQTPALLHEARDAYIAFDVKMVSEEGRINPSGASWMPQILAVLEGIQIYGDKDLTQLLYKEDYRKKSPRSAYELELIEKYKAKKKAREAEQAAEEAQKNQK